MRLQQMPEPKNRRLVRNLVLTQRESGKAPHRFAVVELVFGLRIRKIEPLLQEVDPEHLLQTHRRAAVPGLGVVRLDQRYQQIPWHHRVHLDQKPLAARHLALRGPRQICERSLISHGFNTPTMSEGRSALKNIASR
jgi:hypothetical protein